MLRFIIFALLHSLLAVPDLKKLLTGHSRHLLRFYRLYYNLMSLALFGWTMAAFRNSSVLYVVPGVWSLVLYAIQLSFLCILAVCIRQTGTAEFFGIAQPDRDTTAPTLITSGWYHVVRHPLYLFSTLFLLSNPVISTRWLLLSLFSVTYFLFGAFLEERRLLEEFGSEYQAYRNDVPFLIPRIRR